METKEVTLIDILLYLYNTSSLVKKKVHETLQDNDVKLREIDLR